MGKRNKGIIFSLILIILIGALFYIFTIDKEENIIVDDDIQVKNDYHHLTYEGKEYEYDPSVITILFMGIDTTDPDNVGQADSLQLYLFDRKDEVIDVINISRDTMADIKLYDVSHNELGWERQHLALAFAYGSSMENGAMLTCQAVSKMFNDIPINYFIAMDMSKMFTIHSLVETLEVVVPNDSLVEIDPMYAAGATVTITKDNVETYLRYRNTDENFSNMYRMERQKSYLNAYVKKVKEMLSQDIDSVISKLYNISKQLITNVSLEDIQNFANMLTTYSYDDAKNFHELKGENVLGENHDEFIFDEDALTTLIIDLFYEMEG